MRLAAVAIGLTIAARALGADTAVATDVGYTGALKVAREWIATNGADPDTYAVRLDEGLCERAGSGRCYYIAAWPKGRPPQGSKGDCWLQFWVNPATGELAGMGIVD